MKISIRRAFVFAAFMGVIYGAIGGAFKENIDGVGVLLTSILLMLTAIYLKLK